MSEEYRKAGVDIEKGYESVERIKKHIQKTNRPEVLSQIGGFAGAFALGSREMKEPILVSGTDGVGTKILLAQQSGKADTIGIDCVAMCVNDILAQGAEPLFFLDYLAVGKNKPEVIEQLVAGIADGCSQAGAALIGGETAEMPDLYSEEEYDLAGFAVGIVDKDKMISADQVKAGDQLIALPSSGLHSNGYSLVRKLLFKDNDYSFDDQLNNGRSLIEELLVPTRIYVKDVLPFVQQEMIRGMAHITGGGFYENLPRMFENHLQATIHQESLPQFEIFNLLQELGQMTEQAMYKTFNMGVGMVLAVAPEHVEAVLEGIEDSFVIGEVEDKNKEHQVVFVEKAEE
ncbi:MAG TPA: phosphoribosylformylglycinamidine cyclo-ligase [Alloiococcus sp.]|nr:phosphoribosylformylglycinamidine cyclo-ligase [Alloiococcus sp.]